MYAKLYMLHFTNWRYILILYFWLPVALWNSKVKSIFACRLVCSYTIDGLNLSLVKFPRHLALALNNIIYKDSFCNRKRGFEPLFYKKVSTIKQMQTSIKYFWYKVGNYKRNWQVLEKKTFVYIIVNHC